MNITVRQNVSSIKFASGRKVFVTDIQIARLIGIRTYTFLWSKHPGLYKKLRECSRDQISRAKHLQLITDATDLEALYDPRDLKADLIRIILRGCPNNPFASRLVGSSVIPDSFEPTLTEWFIEIIIYIIFWVAVAITLVFIIRDYANYTGPMRWRKRVVVMRV